VIPTFKTVDKVNMPKIQKNIFIKIHLHDFENIIYTRIYAYVVLHMLLANEQYEFTSSFSTDSASYTLIHEVLSAMTIKHTVGGIFYDLIKVLECVNHRILLAKLEHYGIRGTFGALIKSYLTERYQTFALKDKTNTVSCSNWDLVKHGVTQG